MCVTALLALLCVAPLGARDRDGRQQVRFETTKGDFVVALFDDTPVHRDNFLRLVRSGFYDGILFHRVIKGFMIQAGDPDSRQATLGQALGEHSEGDDLPAEIRYPRHLHVRGALAAAREGDDVNPERKSSGSQFYVVWGRFLPEEELTAMLEQTAQFLPAGTSMPDSVRQAYEEQGGAPHLDGQYTVFGEVVEGLKVRDMKIYEEIFETDAPELDKILNMNLMPLTDSITEAGIVKLTEAKADMLMSKAVKVEDNMRRIFEIMSGEDFSVPPMHLPLKKFSLPMTGASVGKKMNPFYKVVGDHDGLDFMAPLGDEVVASADGVVTSVTRSRKGPGLVVELDHGNGYRTKYAHLQDASVRKGRTVERGQVIGHVGMSGLSFAPHLHYEVWKDTVLCDPVNYFFAAVDSEEYADMFIVSVVTGQSLD